MSFLDKSKENYGAAVDAYNAKKYNSAANRLYYALYQACRGEIIHMGLQLRDFVSEDRLETAKSKNTDCEWWPHDVVARAAIEQNGINLNKLEKQVVRDSQALRVKSDYHNAANVTRDNLTDLMNEAYKLLRNLGVALQEEKT